MQVGVLVTALFTLAATASPVASPSLEKVSGKQSKPSYISTDILQRECPGDRPGYGIACCACGGSPYEAGFCAPGSMYPGCACESAEPYPEMCGVGF